MSDDAVSDSERVTGRAGVQQARRRLQIEIARTGAIYKPSCCSRPFASLTDAEIHITRNECIEGEA